MTETSGEVSTLGCTLLAPYLVLVFSRRRHLRPTAWRKEQSMGDETSPRTLSPHLRLLCRTIHIISNTQNLRENGLLIIFLRTTKIVFISPQV